ncbi:hypothetical protein DIPPA_28723 [Diplonema papillatum]|nr:hypothetical protein DIPPA_28723 [Diplonema papillatum]
MPVFTTSQGCDSRSDRRSESRASDSQLRAGIDLSDVHQKFPDATHCHRCEPRSSNWRSASREATPADMLSSPRLHPGASLPRSTQPASGASAALPLRSESREVHTEESHGADCHCETGQQRHIISTASSRRPEVCEATLAVRLSTSRVHTATSAIECEPSTRSNHGPTQCRGCGSRETGRKREDSPAGNASEIRRQKDAAVRDSCRACDMGRSVYSMATADSFIDARSHAATERATLPQYSTCTSHGCTLHTAYADSIAEPRLPSEVDTSMPTASVANSHKNTSPRRRCRCSAESLRSFAEQCQCSQSGASRCEASSHGTAPFAGFAGVLGPSCRAAGCSIPTVDSFSGSLGDAAPSHTGRASGNMMQSDSFVDVRSQTDQCPTTSCTGRGSMVDTNSLTNVQSHTGCEPLQHWGCTHKKVQASDRFHPEQCHGGVQYRSCCTGYRNVGSLASETHHPNAWQHQANAATVEQVQSAGNIPEARTLRVGCTCAAHDDTQGPQFPSRRACSCCCSATGNTTCHGSVLQLHQSSSEVPALATSRNYIIDSSEPCTGQRIAVHNGTSSTGSTSIHCQTHTMQAHPCGTCISSSQCQTHDTWGHGPPIAFLSNASAQHTDLNVAPWGLGPSNARSNGSVSPVSYECTQRIQKADISIIQRDQHPPHASVHHGQRADINTIPWRQIPSITPASFDESAHRIHETDVSIMPWGQSPANARISNGFVAPVSNESAQHIQKIDVSMIMPGGQSPSIAPVSFDDPAHPAHKNADASTPLARSPSEDDLSGDYLSPTEQRRGEFDRAEQPGPRLRLLSTIEVNDALGSLLPIGSQHPPQQSSNHRQMQTWEHADSACRFQQNPQTRRQVYLQDLQPGSQHELPGNASVLCTQSVRQGPVSPHRGQRQALYYQQQDDTEGRTQRPQQQALLHGLPHPQLPPPQSHQQQQQGGGQDLHPGSAHLDQLLSRRQSHSQGSQHPPPAPAQQQSCRQQPANLLAQRQTQPQGLHAGFQQLQQAPSWHPAPVDSQNLFVDSARGVQLPQPRQSQTQGLHTGFQHPQQQTDSQESFTDSAREVQLPQSQRQAHPRGLHTGFQHPQQAPSHRQQRADSQESLTGPAREIQLPQPPRRQTHPQQAPFQQTQRGGYEPADIMREARSTASDACDRRERPRTIVGGDRPESASFDAPLRRREGAGEHTDGDPARAAAASGPVEAESWEAAMSRIRAIRKQSAKALKGWACDDGAGCGETTGGKREADDPKAAAALPQPKAHLGAPGDGVDVGKGALDDDSAGILRRVRERRSLCQTALQTLRSDLEETALAPKGDLNV